MRIRMKCVVCAVSALSAVACANKPPIPPVLTLDMRSCVDAPDLASAKPLALATDKPLTTALDSTSGCLEDSGGTKRVYTGFRLPEASSEYLVSVTSAPVGQGLSPRLQLLDSGGKVLREIPRDNFVFHGPALYAGLRIRPDERYLIVASDPGLIGQEVSQIVGQTQVATSASGGFIFQVHTGSESTSIYVYALNGSITVTASPMPVTK